ncbi:hypothetical protein [Azospirillum canadense]|nr:hypothetical protein [Azospirillum canadense]MCW2240028.1 hypothetical protein [Azospirillum canadense]
MTVCVRRAPAWIAPGAAAAEAIVADGADQPRCVANEGIEPLLAPRP